MLYGVRPAPHLELDLRPVMTLRASVVALRDVPAGETVGYGGTFRAPERGTRVATLAIGYADGIPWSAGNRGQVWLAGARRPIAGRVSMDSIGVDIGPAEGPAEGPAAGSTEGPTGGSGARVALGDDAILFGAADAGSGSAPSETIGVDEAARAAGTVHYELLVRVGARVPRVVTGQLLEAAAD
jgi:alanine racemase